MKLPTGTYVKIRLELSYEDAGERKTIATTKRAVRRLKKDEKSGEEKIVEEIIDEPIITKLGWGEIPRVLEKKVLEMDIELNKEYKLSIPPEEAYGKRDPKAIESITMKKFREHIDRGRLVLEKERRKPRIGDYVYMNIGGTRMYYGRITSVSDRMVIIDKNHPLAGKKIDAAFVIEEVVMPTDPKEAKLEILLRKFFGDMAKYIKYEFSSDDALELRVDEEYFQKYPMITREIARRILEEIYVPKLLLMSFESELYSEFGIRKLRWIEEKETVAVPPEQKVAQEQVPKAEAETEKGDS